VHAAVDIATVICNHSWQQPALHHMRSRVHSTHQL
jgi:hypothetical protein